MAEQQRGQPSDDLEGRLSDLGRQLDWPNEPNLLPVVRARLEGQSPRRSRLSRLRPAAIPSQLAWAAAALILVVAVVLAISDSTRSTVADRLGISGVSISTERTATVTPGGTLQLGTPTTLDDALGQNDESLILPPETILGPPGGVFMLEDAGVFQTSYVYGPRPDLPEVGDTGVGLLISQFDGNTNESFIQKQLGPDTSIEMTEVNGQAAFWLSGHPHAFFYERPDGDIREESIRLAANVLLWEMDGKTLRIESALDRETVVKIAEAMTSSD